MRSNLKKKKKAMKGNEQDHQVKEHEEEEEEEEGEGIDPKNEYHSKKRTPKKVFSFGWSKGFVAPFLPTRDEIVERALEFVRLEPGEDTICDLGSGDGRFVIRAAMRGVKGVGIEMDENLVEKSRESASASASPCSQLAEFRVGDLMKFDFSSFSVVVVFLFPEVVVRLRPRLESWLDFVVDVDFKARECEEVAEKEKMAMRKRRRRRRLICVRWPLSEFDGEWNKKHLDGDFSTFSSMGFFVYH